MLSAASRPRSPERAPMSSASGWPSRYWERGSRTEHTDAVVSCSGMTTTEQIRPMAFAW
jgi:hypothetical protein